MSASSSASSLSSPSSRSSSSESKNSHGGGRPTAKRPRLLMPSCIASLYRDPKGEEGPALPTDSVEVLVQVAEGLRLSVLEASPERQGRLVEQAVQAASSDDAGDCSPTADPYGAALWPSGLVLAQAVAAYAQMLAPGQRMVELGAGCGLASLTAATVGIPVLATDFRRFPLEFITMALQRNAVRAPLSTEVFDVCDKSAPLPSGDLVVAADMFYEQRTALALAQRVAEARARGSTVLIADVNRPNRDLFLQELRRLLPADSEAAFFCHGMAVQQSCSHHDVDVGLDQVGGIGKHHSSSKRAVAVDILELPPRGPAHAALSIERPCIAVRPARTGPVSLLESTCWTGAHAEIISKLFQ